MPINKIAYSSLEVERENYINVLRAGQSVSDIGWNTYSDTGSINPTDGTGGTASITWSQNTNNPLSGDADFRLVKNANNSQGDGVSIPFTITNRHLAKNLQISFDMELISGNYENPIISPVSGTYSITSTTCTVTANHSFVQGQYVYLTFTSGTVPPNGYYTITSVTSTTFVVTVASGSGTGNCRYTTIGDLRVSIIQDPTGTPVCIEPANTDIQLGIANQRIKHIATFQTHVSITSYRLCIHVGSASTVAYTVDFNNFRIWEQSQSLGAVITDWVSYTPTFTNMGTVTNIDTQWRRVGSNIEVRGRFTVGTTSPALQTFTLPTGLIPNINWTSGNGILVGYITRDSSTEANTVGLLARNDNVIRLGQYVGNASSNNNVLATPSTNFLGSNESQNFYFSVPILGWGSSVAMSSDTGDGRLISGIYRGHTGVSLTANVTTIKFNTLLKDTHNAYNTTTGIFTAPISGDYFFSMNEIALVSGSNAMTYALNNVVQTSIIGSLDSAKPSGFSIMIPDLKAGDTIDFRSIVSVTTVTRNTQFMFHRISTGSQIIATQETVAFRVTKTSNDAGGTTDIDVICNSNSVLNSFDTHGAYNLTTGVITAPITGVYTIGGIMYVQSVVSFSAGDTIIFYVTDTSNNVISQFGVTRTPTNNAMVCVCSSTLRLISGQQIKIRFIRSSNSNQSTLQGSSSSANAASFLTMTRIGV